MREIVEAVKTAVPDAANRPAGEVLEQTLPGNLSAQDWAIMREIVDAVKTAVPDAANRPAGEVLEYVRAKLTTLH